MVRSSSLENKECFVSKIEGLNKWSIRKEVCKELPVKYEFEGNWYCVLHLPEKDKFEDTNFREIYNKRIAEHYYNFRFVYFPEAVFFPEGEHDTDVIFNGAVFTEGAFFRFSNFKKSVEFILTEFHGADFTRSNFEEYASFKKAAFYESSVNKSIGIIEPEGAYFRKTTFKNGVDFTEAKFIANAKFESAYFSKGVYFIETNFSNLADFRQATFDEKTKVYFLKTTFNKLAAFSHADIKGYFTFEGTLNKPVFSEENISLDLQHAKIEKPDKIAFHTVRLFPSWFINTDSRKFIFTDIQWENANGKFHQVKKEITKLKEHLKIVNAEYILKISLRKLAVNAEENNDYEQASKFRRMAFEAERLEYKAKRKEFRNKLYQTSLNHSPFSIKFYSDFWKLTKQYIFGIWNLPYNFLNSLYRLTSLYGENWGRALLILCVILFGFALVFTQVNFQNCPKDKPISSSVAECEKDMVNCKCQFGGLDFREAIAHSLATATFQTTEYRKPISTSSETFVILERIFAPLQVALLALAIRRKFMR